MASKPGKRALVKVTGNPVAFADEPATTTDNKTYLITAATKRVWDREATITVNVAGVATVEVYVLNRLRGTVTFATVDAGRGAVTITGQYLPASVAGGAKSYSYTLTAKNDDDTDFDAAGTNGGFMVRKQVQLDVSGSIGGRFRADPYFRDALTAGNPVVVELFPDRALDPELVCWALLSKSGLQAANDSLIEQDVEFQGTPDADGRAASAA